MPLLTILFLLASFGFFVGGFMVEYVLEVWLTFAKGCPVDVSYWLCGFAGIFVGWNFAIPATIITWISMMFLM